MNSFISLFRIIMMSVFFDVYLVYALEYNTNEHSTLIDLNKESNIPKEWFNKYLADLLYREDIRELFSYIYPFFISEENIFSYLINDKNIEIHDWIIRQLLYSIINNNFPNGVPSNTTLELIEIIFKHIYNPTTLTSKFDEMLHIKRIEEEEKEIKKIHQKNEKLLFNNNKNMQDILNDRTKLYYWRWIDIDFKKISEQLSYVNYKLYKKISLKNIINFTNNVKDDVIDEIFIEEENLINHFSYMILTTINNSNSNILDKLYQIIKQLYTVKNYEGMFIVLQSITKDQIARLLRNNDTYQKIINEYVPFFNNKYYPQIEPLTIQNKKYKHISNSKLFKKDSIINNYNSSNNNDSYWKTMLTIGDNEFYLPSIKNNLLELRQLLHKNNKDITIDKIMIIGKLVKNLCDKKHKSYYILSSEQKYKNGFFTNVYINDEILSEYSNVYMPYLVNNKRELPTTAIEQWNTMDLFSYLENNNTSENILQFLHRGIWDGPSYLTHKQRLNQLNNI